MKGQYFLKDKKAMIYKRLPSTQNENGIWIKGKIMPISAAPLWCYARQESQGLKYEAGIVNLKDEDRMFVFNHNANIDQTRLILYRGAWYFITRVDTTDDYNGDMFVYVREAPLGERPKETDIEPFDPSKL